MCVYCHDLLVDRSHAINDVTKKKRTLYPLEESNRSTGSAGAQEPKMRGFFFWFNHTRIQPYVDYLLTIFSRLPSAPVPKSGLGGSALTPQTLRLSTRPFPLPPGIEPRV